MLATGGGQVVYPVVKVDMRAESSYASAPLISKLNRNPDRREYKRKNDDGDKSEDRNVQGPSLTLNEFLACPLS